MKQHLCACIHIYSLYVYCMCHFKGGHIFSWGQSRYGQLGLGMQGHSVPTPQIIQSLQGIPFAQISAGGAHSFSLTLSGAVFGWGRNNFGQLGLNDTNGEWSGPLKYSGAFAFQNQTQCYVVFFLFCLFFVCFFQIVVTQSSWSPWDRRESCISPVERITQWHWPRWVIYLVYILTVYTYSIYLKIWNKPDLLQFTSH